MTHSLLFKRELHWVNSIISKTLPCNLQSWLNESQSLTQRLRANLENISVQVLFESQTPPFLTERQLLKLPQQRYCLVREVVLKSNQTPLILARTVIPEKILKITQGNLARLGSRPLGEILFSAPSLMRKPLDITKVEPNQWQSNLQITQPLWGRRTQYSICEQPMLVSEFFLPSLFEQ